jgi:hypothetical protein
MGVVEVWHHAFLSSALDGVEWSALHFGRFTHCLGGWAGLRAGLDAVAKRKIPVSLPRRAARSLVTILTELSRLSGKIRSKGNSSMKYVEFID